MWLAASSTSNLQTVVEFIVGAVVTVVVAVISALATFRGSVRSNDAAKEKALDDRIDADVNRLREENAAMDMTIDLLRTKLLKARVILADHNIDPTILDR